MANISQEVGYARQASPEGEPMKIIPHLPSSWTTVGYLYTSDNYLDLGEDMFEATLPNGLMIAAGWSEEGSPTGHYVVSVTNGFQHVTPPYRANSVFDAESYICQVAHNLTVRRSVASSSGNDAPIDAPFRRREPRPLKKQAKSTFSAPFIASTNNPSAGFLFNRSPVTLKLEAAGH